MNSKSKINIKQIMSSDKSRRIFILIGLSAILLIFLSGRIGENQTSESQKSFDTDTYRDYLSLEIENMVESVEGAGNAKVMITLENSYEYIYLDDDETLRCVNEPTIRGVVVACEGGDSPVISAEITNLLRTVLNLPSNKVCVSKLI